MGTTYSPSVVTNGLVMYYDMNNTQKSWRGAPVTNLLPTPAVNSVPTTGNGWGTYNTNQYGSGAYFSIGTVASVSGNIVTMTAAHSLRSYDVMQPQSTGGGVTAGTNYLIKKLSSTTFSLHPYNSSQDGSQGYINPATGTYKVYDDFANDVRISINSTSFPTMWWGYPHLPNSGLVKEVRVNGCSIPGYPTTDCLRLYHTRPDGVTDGMAYGVDTTVTPGVAHTVSFWTKTVNSAAVGQSISYQIYNYTGGSAVGFSFSATLGAVGVWTKQSLTFTPSYGTAISYFFPSSGNIIYDLAHIQFETGSTASSWSNSSRSSTQALLDLTGKTTPTVTSLSYSSDNTNSFSFDGSTNYITVGALSGSFGSFTVSVWFYSTSVTNYRNLIDCNFNYNATTGNIGPRLEQNSSGNLAWLLSGNTSSNAVYDYYTVISSGMTANTWYNAVITWKNGSANTYLNGSPVTVNASTPNGFVNVFNNVIIGKGFFLDAASTRSFVGKIPVVKIYNRALSATEVVQNFNAQRTRYGI